MANQTAAAHGDRVREGFRLAQTKFHPPRLPGDVISRPRLLEVLHQAVATHPLTLVSAPAGCGKTTLLAAYCAEERRSRGAEEQTISPASLLPCSPAQVAWLTLDEEDNDPTRFLVALIAALQRLNPACGTTAHALLTGLPNPSAQVRQVIGVLINDVLEALPDPFVLILDDLHLITESAVFVALDYLLAHLPPQMRLVVGTRQNPPLALARLRVRGHLAELSLADLSFTLEEAARFLNEKLGLGLSSGDLTALQGRTEGWPAGLRLLAGSLQRIPVAERSAFIQHLARTDRHVFEFLAEEVLNRQESAVRTFLLETSILSELTPALCQAVTERADAAELLEEVYRRNLFLVTVSPFQSPISNLQSPDSNLQTPISRLQSPISDLQSPTYRYHALFAEFLRRQLMREMPQRVAGLHRRAAEAQTNPGRAITHYLAAEMWEEAAQIIEQVGRQLLQQGLLDTLTGWIHALPGSVREAHPRLVHFLGACAWHKGDLDTARSCLEQALQGFEAAGDAVGCGEVLTDLANCAFLQADYESSGVLFDRALACPLPPRNRVQSLMGRAGLRTLQEDWAQALADVEEAEALTEASADPSLLHLLVMHLSPVYAFLPGGLERMDRICRRARAHFGDQVSPLRVIIEEYTALLHLWRGQFKDAIQVGERALTLRKRLGDACPFVGIDMAAVVVDAYVGLGDYATAEGYFEDLRAGLQRSPMAEAMQAAFLFEVGRVYWLQGRLEEARRVYAQMCAAENPREWPMAAGFRARMRGMLAMAEGRYAEAEQAFREAISVEQQEHISVIWGGAQMLLAHLYLRQGHPDRALAEVEPLLAESQERGILTMVLLNGPIAVPVLRLAVERGVHAEFAAHLLDILGAGPEPRPVHVPETGETLTPREVEVLRLLVQGAGNREIAERLVISQGTVKSHVHHILRKLDVRSRTEAAARARDLRLI